MKEKVLGTIGVVWGGFILVSGGLRIAAGQTFEGVNAGGQALAFGLGALMFFAGVRSLRKGMAQSGGSAGLREMAREYTAAWCSQDPARVASFFAEQGALTINGGTPSVGRIAITEAARSFMTAFPDMVVTMDRLEVDGARVEYHWTLTGTNTGPGGTGRPVSISGYEEWLLDDEGRIVDSLGRFDQAEYNRQLRG